jgi:hypothetical protein
MITKILAKASDYIQYLRGILKHLSLSCVGRQFIVCETNEPRPNADHPDEDQSSGKPETGSCTR